MKTHACINPINQWEDVETKKPIKGPKYAEDVTCVFRYKYKGIEYLCLLEYYFTPYDSSLFEPHKRLSLFERISSLFKRKDVRPLIGSPEVELADDEDNDRVEKEEVEQEVDRVQE